MMEKHCHFHKALSTLPEKKVHYAVFFILQKSNSHFLA